MKLAILALLLSVAFVAANEDPNLGETYLTHSNLGNPHLGQTVLVTAADQNPRGGPCAACGCGCNSLNVCNPCGERRNRTGEAGRPATPSNPLVSPLTGKALKPVKVESWSSLRGACCCACNNCAGCVVATTCGCQPEYVAPEIREVQTCGCCGQASCGCCRQQVVNACGCCGQATCGCCSTTLVKPELRDVHVQPEMKDRCPCYFTRVEPCPCAGAFRELPGNTAVVDGVKL